MTFFVTMSWLEAIFNVKKMRPIMMLGNEKKKVMRKVMKNKKVIKKS